MGNNVMVVLGWNFRMNASLQAWVFIALLLLTGVELP